MAENPNFISEDQAQQMESAGLWAPLEQPPVSPTAKVPPPQTNINNYGGVPLPQNLGLQPDLTQTIYPPSAAPIRLMPIVQTAAANAASKSVATTVVQKAISELNIPQPTAQVTDGLIHGETPWESDPSYIILRDDFTAIASTSVTSPLISGLPWTYVNSGSGGDAAFISGGFPCLGSVGWTNSSTASGISAMTPFNAVNYPQTFAFPVFDYPSWKMTWIFQLGKIYLSDAAWSWSQVSFYLGLGNWCPYNSLTTSMIPRLPVFCGLRYDTDTTSPSIGDTQFFFECTTKTVSNTTPTRTTMNPQGNTSATGMTVTEGHIYRFEMLYTAIGSVQMTLVDGTTGTSYSATLTMPTWSLANSHTSEAQTTGSGTVQFSFTNSSGSNIAAPFGPGSQLTVSGITTSGYTGLNRTWQVVGGSTGVASSIANSILYGSALPASGTQINGTYTGYPAVCPWFAFGNDSESSPVAASKGVKLDFFSFIWNPGVGGGTGTPNPLKARYF